MDFLHIFLLINAFLIGGVAALAIQHAYAHFRPHPHEEERRRAEHHSVSLSPAMKEHLLDQAKANFQAVLNRSATELGHDLKETAEHLNKELDKIGSEIITDEMKRYHANLNELRSAAEATIKNAQAEITGHQTELKTKLAEEIKAEKEQLIKQIDTKLADAVLSFLMETLQHNVDLGAQSSYLVAMLEEHKTELAKGVADEA